MMTITDYIDLRQRCLDLVEGAVFKTDDRECVMAFFAVFNNILLLEQTESVENTLKGIIGYYLWLEKNEVKEADFRRDAMHDLFECVKYSEEDWYSPRTGRYKRFYKK